MRVERASARERGDELLRLREGAALELGVQQVAVVCNLEGVDRLPGRAVAVRAAAAAAATARE